MDKLIDDLIQKTGIDRATAEKVAGYLKDNLPRIAEMLGQKGGLGGVFGKISDTMSRH
jgi:hypothetical protein